MLAPPPRRLATQARLAAASLAGAGVLSLLLPAVAAASSGHGGGGGGLFVALPMGSIFSDILGSVSGFGKDVVKTIFSSVLSLFFGGSWKVLLHPYEIVEWLIGLPGTGNTTAFVPFANDGAGPFAALVKDMQAIGLGLLPLALANNTLHLVSGGIFTRPRDHMHDFGKVFMAACAIIAWPWLFGEAINLANTITLAVLQAANANGNLWKTLGAYFVTAWAGGFLDLLTTGFLIATALLLVGLIVMKIVLMVALAFLLVIGPIAIAFYPFEFLSRILLLFGTVFLALAMVPLGWAVLFALFTAFGASVFGFGNFIHAGLIGGAMKDTFDLICSLICFYLAWKWPFLIISRVTSIVGGNIAAAGEAFSALGHRTAGGAAPAAGGRGAGSGGAGGATADGEGGMLAGRLAGVGGFAQGLGAIGGGALTGLGSSPAVYAGYGLGAKGLDALRGVASTLRRNGGAGAPASPSTASGEAGSDAPSVSPVGAAVADGPDAGFDAVRAGAKNFSGGPEALPASDTTLAAVPVGPGAADPHSGGDTNPDDASTRTLARDAAMTAALTSTAGASATPAASTGTRNGAQPAASDANSETDTAAHVHAGLSATSSNASTPAGATRNGSAAGSSPSPPGSSPTPTAPDAAVAPRSGASDSSDSDPRQVLQATSASTPPAAAVPVRQGVDPNAVPASSTTLAGQGSSNAPKPSSAHAVSTSPAAAPRSASGGQSPSGPSASAPATPSSPALGGSRPPAGARASRSAARDRTQPPSSPVPVGAASGSTPEADDRPQTPQQPPVPVSPPEHH